MGQGSKNATDEMNRLSCSILRNVELTYPICFPPTKSYDIDHIAIFVVSVLVIVLTFLSYIFVTMSLSILFTMTIDRYLGVLHAIFHRSKVTRKRLLISPLALWL